MPRVMRAGVVNLSGEVVKIRDLAPEVVPKKPPKTPEEEQLELQQDFLPDFGGEVETAAEEPPPAAAVEGDAPVEEAPQAPPEVVAEPEPEPVDYGSAAAVEPEPAPAAAPQAPAAPMPDVSAEIIQSAMAEAGRILETALKDAETQRAGILDGVNAEVEQLRAAAAEEGRRQGQAEVNEKLEEMSRQLVDAIGRFEGGRAAFEAEYEEQMKWMSLEIASKVLAKKVGEDDAVLTEMVDKAVQGVRNEPWVRVDVAQEMTGLLDSLTRLYDAHANIEVGAVPAAPGTVQIETPSGLVDVSLRTQLENLRDYFARSGGEAAAPAV